MTIRAWVLACVLCYAIGVTHGMPQPGICVEAPGYILPGKNQRRIAMAQRTDPALLGVDEETLDTAVHYHKKLCESARIHDTLIMGLGTIEAHAKHCTLEEWIEAWGKYHRS